MILSPSHEHEVEHGVVPPVQDRRVNSPPIEDSHSLIDRGRYSSVGQSSTGPLLWRSERERIP